MKPLLILFLFCVTYLSATVPSVAAPQQDRSSLPITVKSNEMSADSRGKSAVFSGKVVAKQGDVSIFSDKLIVGYGELKGEVEKIEAFGNVRIIQQNRTGYADQALYDSRNGRVVLTGTPRVVQGSDSITGKVITYFLDEEISSVSSEGDPKARVEAVFNPPARKNSVGSR